jgi:hypothetical protein
LLHESEIDKVKGCAVWQDSSNSFQIPLFIIKDRKVFLILRLNFPRLSVID